MSREEEIEIEIDMGNILVKRAEDISRIFSELFDLFADETIGKDEQLRKGMIHQLFLNVYFVEITKHLCSVRREFQEELLDELVFATKKTLDELYSEDK